MEGKNISIKAILILMCIGIWVIVLQNAGFLSKNQNVYIQGGNVEVDNTLRVRGSVEVQGSVSVDNTVDVNLDEVLGYPVGCRTSYTIDGKQYNSIDFYCLTQHQATQQNRFAFGKQV